MWIYAKEKQDFSAYLLVMGTSNNNATSICCRMRMNSILFCSEKGEKCSLMKNDCKERIYAFTHRDWQLLLDLIPEIENTRSFGEWAGGDTNEEGVIQFPYFMPTNIVSRFLKILYSIPIIIAFDWGAWDEGRKIASDATFNLDNTDLLTKCKLITAIVRNDRFCEGALVSAFESGLILQILKSIEKQISASNNKSA